jgi:2-keto-4-pentenoate hydratase
MQARDMDTEQLVKTLLDSYQRGDYCPASLQGKLDIDDAYRAQLGLLEAKLAGGEQQAGWKVGLTADAMREMFGSSEPAFGYLLQRGSMASGAVLPFADLRTPLVENEILVTLDRDLAGPGVSPEDARGAIRNIAPALEIVEMRGSDMRIDVPLGIADNLSQYAFIHGEPIALPPDLDFGDVQAEVHVNGELRESVRGSDVMDNQLQTIAWLANALHRFDRRLLAGQQIMTGSFTKPVPVAAGDRIETQFSTVGAVSVHFQ